MDRRVGLASVMALAALVPPAGARTLPQVSVWYRGTPAGVPQQDDLALIRALGFAAVTWPSSQTSGISELRRQAAVVDLAVDVRPPGTPLTVTSSSAPGQVVDVRVRSIAAASMSAIVWRAVAMGARTIAFDGGEPAGVSVAGTAGTLPAWVATARTIARQLDANARLFDQLDAGVPVRFESVSGTPGAIAAQLFETPRDWVIIATNVDTARAEALATLPAAVPYAPWGDLLDGTAPPMAMRDEIAGPRWRLVLAGGAARIYLTSKKR